MSDATVIPRIHAHRGDSSQYPENTMAAFRAACALGVDAIEFDVHMTEDGRLVVVHDHELSRTTTGTGLVHERSFSYVRALSAGRWFGEAFADERVPTVQEVLSLEGVDFEMELKGVPSRSFASAVAGAVRDAGVLDRTRFTGFHWASLFALRDQLPDACLGLFPRGFEPWMSNRLYEEIVIETAMTGGYAAVHLPHRLLDKVDVQRFRGRGLILHAGGDDDLPSRVLELGVDGLTTDSPGAALEARTSWVADRGP